MEWNPLQHPYIIDGYDISPYGDIRYNKSSLTYKAAYHSSNGYDYIMMRHINGNLCLFPIDEIVAMVYISVPHELCGKPVTVKHINGDNRDISLSNMEWVEDIEIWKTCTYPGVKPNTYEVSNHGNVRNNLNEKEIKGSCDLHGYIRCMLRSDTGYIQVMKHRLIAWEFLHKDEDFNKFDVNHINGIKARNNVKNLDIVDRLTNMHHAYMLKLNENKTCENANRSTITNETCEKVCQIIVKHKGVLKDIMSELERFEINVPKSIVEMILYKCTWVDISDKYFKKDQFRQILSESDVEEICISLIKHKTDKNVISSVYTDLIQQIPNINKKIIYSIMNKNNWCHISDRYFDKGYFRKEISEEEALIIIKSIAKHIGEKKLHEKVVDELKDIIPMININTVRNIHYKNSFSKLSDGYF